MKLHYFDRTSQKETCNVIIKLVAEELNMTEDQIRQSREQQHKDNEFRGVAMYLCRKHTAAPLTVIAEVFGVKSHATVVNRVNAVEAHLRIYANEKRLLESISRKFQNQVDLNRLKEQEHE